MGKYRIFETRTFQEDPGRLKRSGLSRLNEKLQEHIYPQLRDEPHFGPNIKRLKNWETPTWRYRIGAYRFFYEIHEKEKIVFLTASDHRSRAYE